MKKNLIILMLIPFLIALLSVVTITVSFSVIDNDIIGIEWKYDNNEAFKIRDEHYLLEARGVNEKNYPTGPNNELVWEVKNKNTDEEEHAKVVFKDNRYYLEALSEGDVIVTCRNKKGNVSKTFNAYIYKGGYILLNSYIKESGNNIDENIYYGTYDLVNGKKELANIKFNIKTSSKDILDSIIVKNISRGIDVKVDGSLLTVSLLTNNTTKEYFTLGVSSESDILDKEYNCNLNIVRDGVNVYSYDDLLNCTNRSKDGEIVVLRKSFVSKDNYRQLIEKNNVTIFGNTLDEENYKDNVYRFNTTCNTLYIDKWNENTKNSNDKITKELVCGIRVQKDFYGNGYSINMHDLTYPSKYVEVNSNGSVVKVPTLGDNDLFRGPLPLYTLGNHNSTPLIETVGQDNIGMFIDGDNITVNDVDVRNCDFGNMLSNLHYTGTVVETNGDNITIRNSKLQNGRCVLRSYSSMNMTLENNLLSNARNFLVSVGSNDYATIDDNNVYEFKDLKGNIVKSSIKEFLSEGKMGDKILNAYVMGVYDDNEAMKESILSIQNALNDPKTIESKLGGSMNIKDTLFYRSGIASISIDSYFNGPFLYSAAPTELSSLLQNLIANIISGINVMSLPVDINITGKTKFYDYKTQKQMDISGIINENISSFLKEFNGSFGTDFQGEITIDTFFPLKKFLFSDAVTHNDGTDSYVNVPFVFYGGAYNGSKVDFDTLDRKETIVSNKNIDLLDKYISIKSDGNMIQSIKSAMFKSVTLVIGFEPFKYGSIKDGYLFGEYPKINELKENAR